MGGSPSAAAAPRSAASGSARSSGSAPFCLLSLCAVVRQHQRRVQVARRRQAQRALQQDLARRVVGQVRAAHDVSDALRRVVDDHGQLVGPQPVGALQHEVADLVRHVLLLRAQPAVGPLTLPVRRATATRARRLAVQAVAAGAGIDLFSAARVCTPRAARSARDLACACSRRDRPGRWSSSDVQCRGIGGRRAPTATAAARLATVRSGQLLQDQPVSAGARSAACRRLRCGPATCRPGQRASSQLASAATSEPACNGPVGEGAKRPR